MAVPCSARGMIDDDENCTDGRNLSCICRAFTGGWCADRSADRAYRLYRRQYRHRCSQAGARKTHNKLIRDFAQEMVRDHRAVNDKALALVKKLHVTPEANPTSASLTKDADASVHGSAKLNGAAFDRAYIDNEVAYHKTVNGALENTLIPSAKNAELKSLLQTGLTLFREHQAHAEHVAKELK